MRNKSNRFNSAVCTVVTVNYVPYALALYESIRSRTASSVDMWIFVSVPRAQASELPELPGVFYVFVDDLCGTGQGMELKSKYLEKNINAFRWSMKGVLLTHLLTIEEYERAIFLDGDLFFFADVQLLFDKLVDSRVLLTPHWRSVDPMVDESNFLLLFNQGIFNAGFIGVNTAALGILRWWVNLCIYKCEFAPESGLYADQTYLNLMPVYFEGVEVLKHKGCNVAAWNRVQCERSANSDGEVLIAGEFPIVFIHFTHSMIRNILRGKDRMLATHLEEYASVVLKYGGPNILESVATSQKKTNNVSNVRRLAFLVKKQFITWFG